MKAMMLLLQVGFVAALLSAFLANPRDFEFCDLGVWGPPLGGALDYECIHEGYCYGCSGAPGECAIDHAQRINGLGEVVTSYWCECQTDLGDEEPSCMTILQVNANTGTASVSCHNICCNGSNGGCSTPFPAPPWSGDNCPCF